MNAFVLTLLVLAAAAVEGPTIKVEKNQQGQVIVTDAGRPVLQYNYATVNPPEGYLEKVNAGNKKYALPRSNYVHPLYGPAGETLTFDWSKDHPHHRGIYWAWPEVGYQGELGDLHALQKVFARPTGNLELNSGDKAGTVIAENVWKWQDKTPIVGEKVRITVHKETDRGRIIDFHFEFTGIEETVTLARRGGRAYGGFNTRLSPHKDHTMKYHVDPETWKRRRAWYDSVGTPASAKGPVGMCIMEKATNPHYPAEPIQYEYLPWFEPTFPRKAMRYELKKGTTLTLDYRVWIRREATVEKSQYEAVWDDFQ